MTRPKRRPLLVRGTDTERRRQKAAHQDVPDLAVSFSAAQRQHLTKAGVPVSLVAILEGVAGDFRAPRLARRPTIDEQRAAIARIERSAAALGRDVQSCDGAAEELTDSSLHARTWRKSAPLTLAKIGADAAMLAEIAAGLLAGDSNLRPPRGGDETKAKIAIAVLGAFRRNGHAVDRRRKGPFIVALGVVLEAVGVRHADPRSLLAGKRVAAQWALAKGPTGGSG